MTNMMSLTSVVHNNCFCARFQGVLGEKMKCKRRRNLFEPLPLLHLPFFIRPSKEEEEEEENREERDRVVSFLLLFFVCVWK